MEGDAISRPPLSPVPRRIPPTVYYKTAIKEKTSSKKITPYYKVAPRKKRTALKVFRRMGAMLMIGGIAVIMYVPATWAWGWWDRRDLRANFEQQSAVAVVLNQNILSDIQGAAKTEKLRRLAEEYMAPLAEKDPVAQLEIPKLGLNSIIVEGTEEASLRMGPGHILDTPLPGMKGNFGVAGDRVLYGAVFLYLNELEAGDEIIVKTPYGRFVYAVTGKSIVLPDDTTVLQPNGTEMITLSTCDPPWGTSHRLVIQATVTETALL